MPPADAVRIVFVTQTIDADDPNLAQTIDLVRSLARRADEVLVIADRVGRHDLPANVAVRTFGARSRLRRGLRYASALTAALRGGRPDALVAHMSPVFLVLAAPLYAPARVPLLLWYTHWRATPMLRAATRLARLVLTVDRASFPLPGRKVRPVGHAIDLMRFAPRDGAPGRAGPFRLLALGKLEPWKGYALLLDAAERAVGRGADLTVEIRGPDLNEGQRRHRAELEERISARPSLAGRATLAAPVGRDEVPELIRAADAVVSPGGVRAGGEALDKVLFETAACAVPLVASHPSLASRLADGAVRLSFRPGDAADLADVLVGLAEADPEALAEAGRSLRRWVEEEHSVEGWADRVVAAIGELRR